MTDDRMLPCPFCGCSRLRLNKTNERARWVSCADCEAQTDSRPSREAAILLWNVRLTGAGNAFFIEDDDQD